MTSRSISLLLVAALATPGCAASIGPRFARAPSSESVQDAERSVDDAAVWRRFATALPVGTVVRVELTDGTRVRGTLMAVDPDAVVLKPRTRLPEPARRVPFATIASIELERGGIGAGKAVVIGMAAGAATFVAFLTVMVAFLAD